MKDKKIRRLIIVNEGEVIVGILTIDDIGYNINRFAEDVGFEYYMETLKIRERMPIISY